MYLQRINRLYALLALAAACCANVAAQTYPGVLNYSTSGAGTPVHLSAELCNSMPGVKTVHVPFNGASEALTALISGQADQARRYNETGNDTAIKTFRPEIRRMDGYYVCR